MFEVKVTIESPALVEAMNNLASAIVSGMTVKVPEVKAVAQPVQNQQTAPAAPTQEVPQTPVQTQPIMNVPTAAPVPTAPIPLQILHIAVILEVIKFAPPVRAEHKQIHLVLNNITELLSLILFYDNLVCKTGAPHVLNSFQKTVAHIQLAALNVITLAGYAHDQIIAQCFGSF